MGMEKTIIKFLNKPFLISVLASIFLAYLYPQVGARGGILKPEITVKYGAIFMIFFISGISLQRKELVAAACQFRVHLFIQVFSLIFIPLIVQIFVELFGQLYPNSDLFIGFVAVSCMPPPVSSAVLLTKKVGGNEAAAVFNSALGSFLGIFITPALLYLFFRGSGDVPIWSVIFQLSLTVVFPVLLGQFIRIAVGYHLLKHKKLLSVIGSFLLLLIIYTTFCDTFSNHEDAFTLSTVIITTVTVVLLQLIFLALAFCASTSSFLHFSAEDVIAILYCSTHKSLTLGFPILKVLYANEARFILISFPLLVYHPMQILIGSFLVPLLQKWMQMKTKYFSKLHFV
ncbi:sodium/bile acid cotransporter 7-like isoform X1 [Argiope bruennichi]|uniref:sodium/bile acid cotransporter 7-like isoform X1 n=1 Tax=Argiope bruennichi TaxID=94029 RepID=UPI002494EC37|nr:sodium/bile acid cotransporter 7-like isoform X1 [Argiope bruennichi]